jgi:hypothetical protein
MEQADNMQLRQIEQAMWAVGKMTPTGLVLLQEVCIKVGLLLHCDVLPNTSKAAAYRNDGP